MTEPQLATALPLIETPSNTKGLGHIIRTPDSPDLIPGVAVSPFTLWPDDRGYFLEVARLGTGRVANFPANSQVSCALSYPGTIKAFHFHRHQTDFWVPVLGMLQVALVDLRAGSPTFGKRNTLYVGAMCTWNITIPPGIGHGYKVIGESAAMLVYVTNRVYNPEDEGRIAYNDPGIAYDWEIQYK